MCSRLIPQVLGVLGMNVIHKCYQELFGWHGLSIFDLPEVSTAPSSVLQALQHCTGWQELPAAPGGVKVRGKQVCRIPGGVMQLVPATCSAQYSGATVLFKPLDSGLPAGLLASPALVQVTHGTALIPVVNVGSTDVLLYPRTFLGLLDAAHIVSLPAGVFEVPSVTATIASHAARPPVPDQIEAMDLSSLPPAE